MEIGKASELTILSPGEVGWIERAIKDDAMARKVLTGGVNREVGCNREETDAGKACGERARFYAVTTDGKLLTFCEKHWRQDGDPNGMFPLE